MDPQILAVLTGAIVNGLTYVVTHIVRKSGRLLVGEKLVRKIKQNKIKLQPILQKSMDDIAEGIEWEEPPRIEEVCLFLTSPEAEAIVRQIYAAKLSPKKNNGQLDLIQQEFAASLSLYSNAPKDIIEDSARTLLDILIDGCEQNLQLAIDSGILSAHEAKSAFRHRIIIDELESIKKNLDFLTSIHTSNIKEFLEFEENYKRQVGNRHNYITPPHFDAVRKIPINDLYVPCDFMTTPLKKDDEPTQLTTSEFLSAVYRVVILGNPGGGKTTFTYKLCHDLVKNYSQRILSNREVTPILVILREYGAHKKEEKCSILQFIETIANSKYQVQPPKGAFEYLLRNGRAVVIFDGLDELLDTSYRQEISGDVESFCRLYPSVPVIVTSREVGYEQAPLDEKMFEIFRLTDFNDEQVREYAKKWFATDLDLTSKQQREKVTAFYEESMIVPDLRSNPLMLALMCNIYRGENYIPRNRPDVYEKCATMLFERWDKSRGIHVTLPFEVHIRPAMMYLAHWIYSDESLQGGVTEHNLIAKATDYLCPRRFEDREEAQRAALEFIDFCRGRAWVFTDTGTTKEGERLYQFTHRTFLEYFTSNHIVRTNPTPDRLVETLLPKIAKREWDVVAQLAIQLQNKNVEGAGDELLSHVTDKATIDNKFGLNLLSFAVRCLEFMVPSPKVTREITTTCLTFCLNDALKRKPKAQAGIFLLVPSIEILGNLLCSSTENRQTIANCVERVVIDRASTSNEKQAMLALELGMNLYMALFYPVPQRLQSEIREFWLGVSKKITITSLKRIKILGKKYGQISISAFFLDEMSLATFMELNGFKQIFQSLHLNIYPIMLGSVFDLMIHYLLALPYNHELKERFDKFSEDLTFLGRLFLNSRTPQLASSRVRSDLTLLLEERWIASWKVEESQQTTISLKADALFGAFILIAMRLEASDKTDKHLEMIKKSKGLFFTYIRWILLARFKKIDIDKANKEMNNCQFTSEQQAFVWKWIRKEVNLFHKTKRKTTKRKRKKLKNQ